MIPDLTSQKWYFKSLLKHLAYGSVATIGGLYLLLGFRGLLIFTGGISTLLIC